MSSRVAVGLSYRFYHNITRQDSRLSSVTLHSPLSTSISLDPFVPPQLLAPPQQSPISQPHHAQSIGRQSGAEAPHRSGCNYHRNCRSTSSQSMLTKASSSFLGAFYNAHLNDLNYFEVFGLTGFHSIYGQHHSTPKGLLICKSCSISRIIALLHALSSLSRSRQCA